MFDNNEPHQKLNAIDFDKGFLYGIPEMSKSQQIILLKLVEIFYKTNQNILYNVIDIAEKIGRKRNSLYPYINRLAQYDYVEIIYKTNNKKGRPTTQIKLSNRLELILKSDYSRGIIESYIKLL